MLSQPTAVVDQSKVVGDAMKVSFPGMPFFVKIGTEFGKKKPKIYVL